MIILSWNLQKITAEKARLFAVLFGQVLNEVIGDEPFVVIIYENRSHPAEVLDALGTGINAQGLVCKWIDTGGVPGLRENVLVICGNGASFDDPVLFTAWQAGFDSRCAALHQAEKDAVRADIARLGQRPARAATLQARDHRVAQVDKGSFSAAAEFRCPVEITLRCQGRQVRVLALHAPGPGAGAEHEQTFAQVYAESIFASAKGFDLVLGDFNLRTHGVQSNGFVDQGVRIGATTKGSEEGRHTFSRLDRVYARPGFALSSALVSDSQERDLTDHHCLAVRVESRKQLLISDYFAVQPSPMRRQEIVYANRRRAADARRINPKNGNWAEQARERRHREADERRQRERQEWLAAARRRDNR